MKEREDEKHKKSQRDRKKMRMWGKKRIVKLISPNL